MLKFLLARSLPRERPIAIDLPEMKFADDAVEAMTASSARYAKEGSAQVKERS